MPPTSPRGFFVAALPNLHFTATFNYTLWYEKYTCGRLTALAGQVPVKSNSHLHAGSTFLHFWWSYKIVQRCRVFMSLPLILAANCTLISSSSWFCLNISEGDDGWRISSDQQWLMKAIKGSWRLLSEDFSYWFQKGHWIWIMPNEIWWLNQATKRRNTWVILNAVQEDREYPEEIEVNVLTRLNVQDINGGIGLIWPLWSSPSADSWKRSSQTPHERISCFSVTCLAVEVVVRCPYGALQTFEHKPP